MILKKIIINIILKLIIIFINMGSSVSLLNIDIYLSYPYKNEWIDKLEIFLQTYSNSILSSDILNKSLNSTPVQQIKENMELIMKNTKYIIVCVSKKSTNSYSQCIEIDGIEKNNILNNISYKIIYIIMENDYNPINNLFIKNIIGINKWLPLYNEKTCEETLNELYSLLNISI